MAEKRLRNLLVISAILAPQALGFVVAPQSILTQSTTALQAKKKKGKRGGKGFGKAPPAPARSDNKPNDNDVMTTTPSPASTASEEPSFLQSVESGGSDSIPTVEKASSSSEPELPPQERAKKLLREQYGLRTLEEQRMEDNRQEQRKKIEDLKRMADKGDDIDIMAMLPAPLLKGIDTFLKLGVGICTVLFVTAGLGITAEAWSKTSGNPLPQDIDDFIVNVVEPNFTVGLFVLLGFSVSLGGFAALQLGSSSSQYKEE